MKIALKAVLVAALISTAAVARAQYLLTFATPGLQNITVDGSFHGTADPMKVRATLGDGNGGVIGIQFPSIDWTCTGGCAMDSSGATEKALTGDIQGYSTLSGVTVTGNSVVTITAKFDDKYDAVFGTNSIHIAVFKLYLAQKAVPPPPPPISIPTPAPAPITTTPNINPPANAPTPPISAPAATTPSATTNASNNPIATTAALPNAQPPSAPPLQVSSPAPAPSSAPAPGQNLERAFLPKLDKLSRMIGESKLAKADKTSQDAKVAAFWKTLKSTTAEKADAAYDKLFSEIDKAVRSAAIRFRLEQALAKLRLRLADSKAIAGDKAKLLERIEKLEKNLDEKAEDAFEKLEGDVSDAIERASGKIKP
jgi:hypothetical protein